MYDSEDITNFHGSLALSSRKIARYFESPSYAILLNCFYFFYFCFHGNVIGPHLQLHMSDDMQN